MSENQDLQRSHIDKAINTYNAVEVETSVNVANPLQLIVLLYDGAIKNINNAVDALLDENFATKGRLVNRTLAILDGLRDALDFEKGGDIARNLFDLYEYMKDRLTYANLKNDPDAFHEVKKLLSDIREAWVELAAPGGQVDKLIAEHDAAVAPEAHEDATSSSSESIVAETSETPVASTDAPLADSAAKL